MTDKVFRQGFLHPIKTIILRFSEETEV